MEGAIQSLATNVAQLLSEEYKRLRGVGGEIAELRDDMATMNALIHMQSQADDRAVDSFIREWMKQLREVAFDADNCIDKYTYRVRSRSTLSSWAWLKHQIRTLSERHRLAGEISALRARTTTICERHARYGISLEALRNNPSLSSFLDEPLPASAPASTSVIRRADPQPLVGISDSVETLAKRLLETPEENLSTVFFVVGCEGVGKTTLAREVCRRLEAEFPYQAMVRVSEAFEPSRDLEALLNGMLQQIVTSKTDNENVMMEEEAAVGIDSLRDYLAALGIDSLEDYLSDKRYLVVIDDVWTIQAWEAIKSKLLPITQNNNCGSRIMVTTRIKALANACSSPYNIHYMRPLNLEDSKKLFVSIAFGKMGASYPEEFEEVMLDVSEKFCGLPLAIVRDANRLAGYTSSYRRDKWKTICKSIGSQLHTNPTFERLMKHVVTLSYDHLPPELKGCTMYLSIFPEDYRIDKKRLLRRWIAEGLIPEKRGWTPMEVAEYYFDELVRRNMVTQLSYRDGQKVVESCLVHDMLLDVLVSKSLESNFVSLLGGPYEGISYDRIRRLSIQEVPVSRSYFIEPGMMAAVKHVRSLSVFQDHSTTRYKASSNPLLHRLDNNFHKFEMLRVLDLEDYKGLTTSMMICICRLYLLNLLNLKGTDIEQVPPNVGYLENLQTFDIRDTDNLRELPETLIKLEKLECLQYSSTRGPRRAMWKLPRGLRKMKALRAVSDTVLGDDIMVAREVGELENLQEMCLYIDSGSICDTNTFLQELARSVGRMYSLRHLNIGDLGCTSILGFLHDLPRPPFLLRFLRITGQIGGRLPAWIGALTNLVEFVISWVDLSGDEPFSILCELPNLRSISMEQRYYTDDKLVARTCHNFPALANLTMTCNWQDDPTPSVFEFEGGAMSKLETLVLDFQDYDKTIRGTESLKNLREVRLIGKRSNPALHRALEQLKAENRMMRTESNKFQVVVKYCEE